MIDYTLPPIAYLVRMPPEDAESALSVPRGWELAEEVARFLSYEEIGPIVSAQVEAAERTAQIIFDGVTSTHSGVEVDAKLEQTIGVYLREREAGPPAVLVCDLPALRAGLVAANVRIGSGHEDDNLVAPGGIVSIHRDPRAPEEFRLAAIARHMILNWKFCDLVAMAADKATGRQDTPIPC